jgi:AcrR family transcriptional regulator
MLARPAVSTGRTGQQAARQSILEALDRLRQHQVLNDIGVSEILSEAGLSSRTTCYRHFGNSNEAFIALAHHAFDEIGAENLHGSRAFRSGPS